MRGVDVELEEDIQGLFEAFVTEQVKSTERLDLLGLYGFLLCPIFANIGQHHCLSQSSCRAWADVHFQTPYIALGCLALLASRYEFGVWECSSFNGQPGGWLNGKRVIS